MAHNIHFNEQTGKHSFFSTKEKAWHNLGQIVEDYSTSAEAIRFAGLDYTVEKRKLYTLDSDNQQGDPNRDTIIPEIEVPDHYANVRTDTDEVLGVVGSDYEIVQNTEAFAFFDNLVGGKDGINYETAGGLGKAAGKVFITAKLPDFLRVAKEDLIEQYLFLTTSHDGYGSITAAFTPIRIVCNNTLNAAMRQATNCVRIRHTTGALDRLREAHKLLGITHRLAEELEEVFNHWARVRISDPAVKRLIQVAMVPNKETLQALQTGNNEALSTQYNNMVQRVFEYAMSDPTQQDESTKGTLYGAYNSASGYFQNVRNYRDEEAKLKSIMQGTAFQRSQAAFDLCREYARHGADALAVN